MKWTIHYYNLSVKEDSRDLPKSIKAKFEAIMDKMVEYGPDIGLPFTKAMGRDCLRSVPRLKKALPEGCFIRFLEIPCYSACVFKKNAGNAKKRIGFGHQTNERGEKS